MSHHLEDWEKEFDKENWHAIEGVNGKCACGTENGVCHIRLKEFIQSQFSSLQQKIEGMKRNKKLRENSLISPLESYRIEDQEYGYNQALEDVLALFKKNI